MIPPESSPNAPPLLDYVIVRLGEEWHGYDHAAVYARRADERALGLLVPRSLAGPKRHAALRAMRETAERVVLRMQKLVGGLKSND